MNKRLTEAVISRKRKQDGPVCAFVYDLDHLHRHVQKVLELLPERCEMYYAMKANSERPVLETMAPLVHGFEVASGGEIQKAREVDENIPVIFGGPGKTDEELEKAIRMRVSLIHAESLHELRRLAHLAEQLDGEVRVLLRVNLSGPFPAGATLHMAGRPTAFGIDERDVPTVLEELKTFRRVRLEGFHFHSVSNHLQEETHLQVIRHYIRKAKGWAEEHGLTLTRLNAGGGIGVNYREIDKQFDWATFCSGLGELLDREFPANWTLMFECGRFLTASCGVYVTEVIDLKTNHGETFAIIRGGTHHFRLPASWQHNHPFEVVPVEEWNFPFPRREVKDEPVTVVGQLCTPKDTLARNAPVKRLRTGDLIVFQYTGAYGWSISHHDFLSHPHPDHIWLPVERGEAARESV